MHPLLVKLLKRKYVFMWQVDRIVRDAKLSEEDKQDFLDTYQWMVRIDNAWEDNMSLCMKDLKNNHHYSEEVELELFNKWKQWSKEAKDMLVLSMYWLVINNANKYKNVGISFLDMVNEWMLWVEKAVHLFDPSKWRRLSTYSDAWIHHYILAAIARNDGIITLPLHLIAELKLIDNTKNTFFQKYNRYPSIEELYTILNSGNSRTISKKRIERIAIVEKWITYFWEKITEDSNNNIWDFLEDKNIESPLDVCEWKYKQKYLMDIIDNMLWTRWSEIIKLRYGIWCPKQTLEQIGKTLWITRERVRQIEKSFKTRFAEWKQLNSFLSL